MYAKRYLYWIKFGSEKCRNEMEALELRSVDEAMAVSTAMSLGPIVGPIMAAVNSAMVIATTATQIAKIKSTSFDSSGSSMGGEVSAQAAPTPAAMEYVPNYSTNVTGNSETVNLANAVNDGQKDQRVYVVESDINEVGKRVEVREKEVNF